MPILHEQNVPHSSTIVFHIHFSSDSLLDKNTVTLLLAIMSPDLTDVLLLYFYYILCTKCIK